MLAGNGGLSLISSIFAKPAIKPALHQRGQNHIAHQYDCQEQPVWSGKRDKPERSGQGRNRQPGTHRDDDDRRDDERPTGPALDKRDLVGADDMNDQRLGEQRLDEPAGVEQGWVVPAIEHVQQHEECQVIEDRAYRPDKQNKAQDPVDLPLARLAQPLGIHCIGGDGGLREIVEEVIG